MKNLVMILTLAMALVGLCACSSGEDKAKDALDKLADSTVTGSTTGNKPTGHSSTDCTNYSGTYRLPGVANLVLLQTDCASIAYDESCTGDTEACRMMGITDRAYTLPLNGVPNANSISAVLDDSGLIITDGNGYSKTVQNIQISAHPCDSNNPDAGLEVNVSTFQGSDAMNSSSTSCQPFTKR